MHANSQLSYQKSQANLIIKVLSRQEGVQGSSNDSEAIQIAKEILMKLP
jgi:hypothetical protein